MHLSDTFTALCAIRNQFSEHFLGQEALVESIIISFFAGGHLLLEGPPGVGKTRGARLFSQLVDCQVSRISFTADLMPSDIIGGLWYHPGTGEFSTRKGPIFTDILIADEVNRAPAKVQSALLEAMAEGSVSIADETYSLSRLFYVIATQNSLDNEGTYALPEAQMDRFMASYRVPQMRLSDEQSMLSQGLYTLPTTLTPLVSREQVATMRHAIVDQIFVAPEIIDYITRLSHATRDPQWQRLLRFPLGPRATISLLALARTHAALSMRDHVIPEDIQKMIALAFPHRLSLNYSALSEGVTPDIIVSRLLSSVPIFL